MKRIVSILLCICFILSLSVYTASAENNYDAEENIEIITENNISSSASTLASGLIFNFSLTIERQGSSTLWIYGHTSCDPTVVKCGFKDLEVQRRKNSSYSWSVYHDYGDEYIDSYYKLLSRSITVEPGYQYRVVCKHYAKKSLLSTQTISNDSGYVYF